MEQKYRIYKVFDCQTMPENVRRVFFEYCEAGNDTYVNWCIRDTIPEVPPSEGDIQREMIDQWLIENGAEDQENVLISHWW